MPVVEGVSEIYHQLEDSGRIQSMMSLENFLNPVEEEANVIEAEIESVSDSELIDLCIDLHIGKEEDVEMIEAKDPPTISEAITGIDTLVEYLEAADHGLEISHSLDLLGLLRKTHKQLSVDRVNQRKQVTLDKWFGS